MFLSHKWTAVLGIAALLAATSASAAKEPLRLKPSSKWQMDYSPDSCNLARKFGEGDDTLILMLERFVPSESFHLSLAGKPVKQTVSSSDFAIRFGPAEVEQTVNYHLGTLADKMPIILVSGPLSIVAPTAEETLASELAIKNALKHGPYLFPDKPPVDPARLAAVNYVAFGKPFKNGIILETGSLKSAFTALEKCTDELVTHWGIDLEKHKSLKRKATPKKSPAYWLSPADYPKRMLARGGQTIVRFRLNVDAMGKPSACHIQKSTKLIEFDAVACRAFMTRARFDPALANDGTPIASYYSNTVRFEIPD
jgi:TonB family protein